jgi:hypothetical protein
MSSALDDLGETCLEYGTIEPHGAVDESLVVYTFISGKLQTLKILGHWLAWELNVAKIHQ